MYTSIVIYFYGMVFGSLVLYYHWSYFIELFFFSKRQDRRELLVHLLYVYETWVKLQICGNKI